MYNYDKNVHLLKSQLLCLKFLPKNYPSLLSRIIIFMAFGHINIHSSHITLSSKDIINRFIDF